MSKHFPCRNKCSVRQWNLCEMFTKWRSDTKMFSFDNFASVKIGKMWRSAHKMQKWQFAVLQCPRSGCFPPNVRRVGICKIWSVDNIQWRSWPLGVLSFQSTPCMGGKKVLEIKMLSSSMWQAWSVSKGWWGLKWQLLCVVGKWGTLALKPNPRRTIHRQKDDAEQ